MPRIDLNARRREQEPKIVVAGEPEREYVLPSYLPASLMESMLALGKVSEDPDNGVAAVRMIYELLFGKDKSDQAMVDIGMPEVLGILKEAYDIPIPESVASVNS